MQELLALIKDDFPDRAMDISASLQLLKETIGVTVSEVNKEMSKSIENRDLNAMEKYSKLIKKIYIYESQLEEMIELLEFAYGQRGTDGTGQILDKNHNDRDPNYAAFQVAPDTIHSLRDEFTHIRPFGFSFIEDNIIEVSSWKEMLLKTSKLLIEIDREKFLGFEHQSRMHGRKRQYFSSKSDDIGGAAMEVIDNFYIETNLSSNGIRDLIIKIIGEYGYGLDDYKVYFWADYTELHT